MSSKKPEKLHDYVRRVIDEKGFSYREVSARSGGHISPATVSDIINQKVKTIKVETLFALANGLEVSPEEVFAIYTARPLVHQNPLDEIGVFFYGWEDASEENKRATLESIKMIAESFQRRRQQHTGARAAKRPSRKSAGKAKQG